MSNFNNESFHNEESTKLEFVIEEVLHANKTEKGSHYKLPNLPTNASNADVKQAYKKKALKLHPDKK